MVMSAVACLLLKSTDRQHSSLERLPELRIRFDSLESVYPKSFVSPHSAQHNQNLIFYMMLSYRS